MSNGVVHKFERDQKRIGKYLMGVLGGAYCIPERTFRVRNRGNGKNFRGGFHLDQVFINDDGAIRTGPRTNITERAGLALLGEGADGTVYIGHYGSASNDPVAIKLGNKKSLGVENKIMKHVEKISPHTQHVYIYKDPSQCAEEKAKRKTNNPLVNSFGKDTAILYSEYANGGSLNGFIKKYGKALSADHMKSIAFQVLWTLHAIMAKYPSFRHCDLILDNVFVDNTQSASGTLKYEPHFEVPQTGMRMVIGDFANSHIDKVGYRNPTVSRGDYMNTFGIFDGMSAVYDAHLFLTQLDEAVSGLPAAADFHKFVTDCIPKAYMPTKSGKSAKLHEQRLRPNTSASKDIAPVYGMLQHPYFSEYEVDSLTGPKKFIWPHDSTLTVKLVNPEKPKRKRGVVKRALTNVNQSMKNMNAQSPPKFVGPLEKPINMNAKRREMLMNALVHEKKKENKNMTTAEARAYVIKESRGGFLPKTLAYPVGSERAIIPNAARSLNNMVPSKKKVSKKKAGSAPSIINTTKTKKAKIPLNRRRFIVNGNNNNNSSTKLFKQLVALRQSRINVPQNNVLETAPIKMMPKAAAKVKKMATGGTKQAFGPPTGLTLPKQKRWWKSQVEVDGDLFIGGKPCEKHTVAVIKTVMDALGKKKPPRATKSDLCRLIKMHVSNGNSNNNNNNSNNNNINIEKRRMPARPTAAVRSPITLEEARRRLRERTADAKRAKKQTKVKKTKLGRKPAKVFPM